MIIQFLDTQTATFYIQDHAVFLYKTDTSLIPRYTILFCQFSTLNRVYTWRTLLRSESCFDRHFGVVNMHATLAQARRENWPNCEGVSRLAVNQVLW